MTINKIDVIGGLCLFALGTAILSIALTYQVGTATRMGPGYFPMMLGGIMMVLAILITISGFRNAGGGEPVEISWRPMFAVLLSVAGFMVGLAFGGLLPAVVLTVAISSLGDSSSRWPGILMLCIVLPIAAWALFSLGLGMPIPLFKAPF